MVYGEVAERENRLASGAPPLLLAEQGVFVRAVMG